jgi:hypothetical protein
MATKTRKSTKRFSLVHVYGGVDPSVIGKTHKTYESLLQAAQDFVASDAYNEGEDGVFYILTQANRSPQMGSFTSGELEGD